MIENDSFLDNDTLEILTYLLITKKSLNVKKEWFKTLCFDKNLKRIGVAEKTIACEENETTVKIAVKKKRLLEAQVKSYLKMYSDGKIISKKDDINYLSYEENKNFIIKNIKENFLNKDSKIVDSDTFKKEKYIRARIFEFILVLHFQHFTKMEFIKINSFTIIPSGFLGQKLIVDISRLTSINQICKHAKIFYNAFQFAQDLSLQENTIIKLICNGKSNEEICNILCISSNTIASHNKNIYDKLNPKTECSKTHLQLRQLLLNLNIQK